MRVISIVVVCTALTAAAQAQDAATGSRGETVYSEHCARCHDLPDSRAPGRSVIAQMSVNRIIRTMDFGAMMSVTYSLDRDDRLAVAAWLGVPGEDRDPPAAAFCSERAVTPALGSAGAWNGWSPAPGNTRYQGFPGFTATDLPRLVLDWAFGFAGDVNAFAPPAVIGDDLFVGSAGGSIYSLEA
ncbi:MAG TPA: cytochrome c, partial [Gammaproteobacteria bacterium]|nr:cytochrome c [Gammaproteobacteria bacterium]